MRETIWKWLLIFDSLWVIGQLQGKYKDPLTKKELDLRSEDRLICITGLRRAEGEPDGAAPVEVTCVAGAWLARLRHLPHVLPSIGDVEQIASIKAGGESRGGRGSRGWAQSLALGLNQRRRERS